MTIYEPVMCRDCCLQVCTSLSACVPCQEKRLQHIEKRIYKTEQQISHIRQEVDANTTCRKNQANVIEDVANLEIRIEKLTQYYETLHQSCFKDVSKNRQSIIFDKIPTQLVAIEEINVQEKRRQMNDHERSVEKIHKSLNEIEKWSRQSLHRQPTLTNERNKSHIPEFSKGPQRLSHSYVVHDTLPTFNVPQRPLHFQDQQNNKTSADHDITDFLHDQQQVFGNLYNILKTDRDPSLQAISSTERGKFNRGRILSQDEKISAFVDQLQKEFQHLAELLKKEKESSPENIDHKIAQKLEELGKKFQSLTEILKCDSPQLNLDLQDPEKVSHYEQIKFYLEELQLEFQELASLLKHESPSSLQSSYPKLKDEHIARSIGDIQKRFQRLTQLLNPDTAVNTDTTQIAKQDDLIANYLQELQQEFQQLSGFLKTSPPSQN